jgi:hypothetical protein
MTNFTGHVDIDNGVEQLINSESMIRTEFTFEELQAAACRMAEQGVDGPELLRDTGLRFSDQTQREIAQTLAQHQAAAAADLAERQRTFEIFSQHVSNGTWSRAIAAKEWARRFGE